MKLNVIKELYLKKYNKGLPILDDAVKEIEESLNLDTKRILNVYNIRYENYKESRNKSNVEYENLIKCLSGYDGEFINIYNIKHDGGFTLVFTDNCDHEILVMFETR